MTPSKHGYILGTTEDVKIWADPLRTRGGIWTPLELVVAPQYRANFMFMGLVDSTGGVRISLYKHDMTREYINVDMDGRLYEWTGREDEYVLLSLDLAKSRLVSRLQEAIDDGVDISIDGQAVMEKLARLLAEDGNPIRGLRPPRQR